MSVWAKAEMGQVNSSWGMLLGPDQVSVTQHPCIMYATNMGLCLFVMQQQPVLRNGRLGGGGGRLMGNPLIRSEIIQFSLPMLWFELVGLYPLELVWGVSRHMAFVGTSCGGAL